MELTEARRIAADWARALLSEDPPLTVAPWGWETDAGYLVLVDTSAALPPDPNPGLALVGGVFLLIEKGSREVAQIGWEQAHAIQDHAVLVGDTAALAAWQADQ